VPDNPDLITAAGVAEQSLGRADSAVALFRRAATLDPRSGITSRRLARAYLWLRRYAEATAETERGLTIVPGDSSLRQNEIMIRMAQGDLAGARILSRPRRGEDPVRWAAFLSLYWDTYWALDRNQQDLVLRLTPSAFDDNRASWALVLAEIYALRGDAARRRAFGDSALMEFKTAVAGNPTDAQTVSLQGLALAFAGRRQEALREAERAVAMVPSSRDAYTGPYIQLQLVRVYIETGEAEKAIDTLEPLLRIPFYLSPGWLRIDPTFDPLRGNPRFQRLVAGG
jgi:Flp pilus assembly protein TadD